MKNRLAFTATLILVSLLFIIPLTSCSLDAFIKSDTVSGSEDVQQTEPRETNTIDKTDTADTGDLSEMTSEEESESEDMSESQTEAEAGPNAESDSEFNTESETESEVITESETESEVITESETESEVITESETESETVGCPHEYSFACTGECLLCGETRDAPLPHTYPADTACEDLVCEVCGFTIPQSHNWKLTAESTATLLTKGTSKYKCSKCLTEEDGGNNVLVDPLMLGIPVIYISDPTDAPIPLAELEKSDGEIVVRYKYVSNNDDIQDFECGCEIKIQGASSAGYPKKNFTVKFYEDETLAKKFKVDLGWGKENKYCMKANYIDFSQARNVVAAQMFAQVVASRNTINSGLQNAPNYGLIDGYPVLVYLNDTFHGLYTMNIPKDNWTFAMDGEEEAREALLMADAWKSSVALREQIGEITADTPWEYYGWEVEHCSTADEMWIRDSFNNLIKTLNDTNPNRIRRDLPKYLDIEAAIDNMIFTYFLNAADNRSKNILWATYDGVVWIPSMYDMDGTFGNYWNGQPLGTTKEDGLPENTFDTIPELNNGVYKNPPNKLWEILVKYYPEHVQRRYGILRDDILTTENTRAVFGEFFEKIPEIAYTSDIEKWHTPENRHPIPYQFADTNRTNMYSETEEQLARLDAFFLNLVP